jgi:hypothetical protein
LRPKQPTPIKKGYSAGLPNTPIKISRDSD